MQSSLCFSDGVRRGFKFHETTNPFVNHGPLAFKFPNFLHFTSTTLSPSSLSLSSSPLCSHTQSQSPLLKNTTSLNLYGTSKSTLHPLRCGTSSNSYSDIGDRSLRGWIELIGEAISTAFPVWVALGCLLGLMRPSCFNWVQPRWTVLGITLTMLGMGMTLTFGDLRGALSMPKELLSGFLLQYSVRFFLIK